MPTFTPQNLGQTEKALNAILERELAGTGLSERHWIALTLTRMLGDDGPVAGDELMDRLGDGLKIGDAEARILVTDLAAMQLLAPADADGSAVSPTEAGLRLHGQISASIARITNRLWGDLPPADLDTAGGVLATILARANAELAT